MDYVSMFFVIGIVLLACDLLFLNINVLVFVGLGAIAASLSAIIGLVPVHSHPFIVLLGTTAILTLIITVLLWKPLLKYQNKSTGLDDSSDIIGMTLSVTSEISLDKKGKVNFSGVEWTAKADPDFVEEHRVFLYGSEVTVTKITGNLLWVK